MPNQQTQPYERTLTDDINTTPEISVDRFRFGRIINRSGGPVTLTVHESEKHGSPICALRRRRDKRDARSTCRR